MGRLEEILENRAWLRRAKPFPHVVAPQVFTAGFYNALSGMLRAILARGLSETPSPGRFSRNIPGYDSYGIGFDTSLPDPLRVFLSPEWRDMLSDLFGIGRTPYVSAGSHYHAPGSGNGFIHNDYNPVWFQRSTGTIQVPNNQVCAYKTGAGPLPESEKVQVVRGAVVLFYLLNDGWRVGDGGETGLYTSGHSAIQEPASRCPPVNNSLLAFECTPHSFHAFMKNTRIPRTSIIMWVHRTPEDAASRWSEQDLERWAV
jgi:hypothetical protein